MRLTGSLPVVNRYTGRKPQLDLSSLRAEKPQSQVHEVRKCLWCDGLFFGHLLICERCRRVTVGRFKKRSTPPSLKSGKPYD